MKVLIENTVPLNNGDAALIFSIGEKFREKGDDVFYSTPNAKKIKNIYTEKNWIESLLTSRIVKIPILGFIYLILKILFDKERKKFDIIISAPGGYITSNYNFKRRLQVMVLHKILLRKKIYMYSQSIGPLNSKDKANLKRYINFFDLFYVRDNISKKRVDELGDFDNVYQTKDAAFLLSSLLKEKSENKNVAISVREWKFDDKSQKKYIELIKKIAQYFYDKDYQITFLSTCQGDLSYKNDAIMATKIFNELSTEIQKRVIVDGSYYKLDELRECLKKFDYVIGTRLHMCVLSWLSDTPAFNISYEEKGIECYDYMGIEEFSVDYNFDGDIKYNLDKFVNLNNYDLIFDKVKNIQYESEYYFNNLYNNIIKN